MLNFLKDDKGGADPMDPNNINFLQKMALKQLERMSPEERENLMKRAMSPENIQKNKNDILDMLEQMEKSGQMNPQQIFEAKKRLGLL